MTKAFDPKLVPARDDLAADHLKAQVRAGKYSSGSLARIVKSSASLYIQPGSDQELQTELLFGEPFMVYERKNGQAWGQALRDQFVGYVDEAVLGDTGAEPDHWVSAIRTPLYAWPDLKAPVRGFLHRNSLVHVGAQDDHYVDVGAGWVHVGDVRKRDDWLENFVEIALSYLHVPYVWGGRTSFGLDCSALVQNALQATGQSCPRDAYMQETAFGRTVEFDGQGGDLRRGDLLFWKGHVGIMVDADTLLHANAHHMACEAEPVRGAIARIKKTAGPVTSVRRFD